MTKINERIGKGIICILALFTAFSATADKKNYNITSTTPTSYMQVKCFVEYRGGGDDILIISAKYSLPDQAINYFQGYEVTKENERNSKVVHKVKECVEVADSFKNNKANKLDKRMLL